MRMVEGGMNKLVSSRRGVDILVVLGMYFYSPLSSSSPHRSSILSFFYLLYCCRYAHENGCPWSLWTTTYAAIGGSLACLRYSTSPLPSPLSPLPSTHNIYVDMQLRMDVNGL